MAGGADVVLAERDEKYQPKLRQSLRPFEKQTNQRVKRNYLHTLRESG